MNPQMGLKDGLKASREETTRSGKQPNFKCVFIMYL